MEYLTSLRYLYVKDNPFKPPLHKLNNAGNQAIMLPFLADLLNGRRNPRSSKQCSNRASLDSSDSPSVNRNLTLQRNLHAHDTTEAGGLAIIPIEELDLGTQPFY